MSNAFSERESRAMLMKYNSASKKENHANTKTKHQSASLDNLN
jgi:hypothetical protein